MFILLLTRKRFQRSMTIPPWMIQWRKLPRSCRRCRCWFLCWFCSVGSATHHVSLDVSLDFDRIWRRMQPSRSLQRQCRVQRRQKHRIVSMEWHHKHENIIHGIVLFCWTGSDSCGIIILQSQGQGDMANMSSYLSVLLQHCCIDVNV